MSKKRIGKNKKFFRKVHFQALAFLLFYVLLSKTIFVRSLASGDPLIQFFVPYFYGVIAGGILLYLFNHEDFFHFIKEVEKTENKREQKYLKKYIHYGKIISTLIIAGIGGPIFAALTARLLLNRFWYKYIIIAAGNIASTLIAVMMAKGALNMVFRIVN